MPRRAGMSLFLRRGAMVASFLAIVFAFSTPVFADTPATEQLKATISTSAGMLVVADHMLERDALSRFYALRQYQLAWSSDALDHRRTDIAIRMALQSRRLRWCLAECAWDCF